MSNSLALMSAHEGFKTQMISMWKPQGVGSDPPSLTIKEVCIHIPGVDEVLKLPVQLGGRSLIIPFYNP